MGGRYLAGLEWCECSQLHLVMLHAALVMARSLRSAGFEPSGAASGSRLGAKGAVEIIFRQDIGDPEKIAERTKEYEQRFANPFVAASKGFVDEVIMPHSTRRRIALGLRKLRNKALENPWKKHDNIPL